MRWWGWYNSGGCRGRRKGRFQWQDTTLHDTILFLLQGPSLYNLQRAPMSVKERFAMIEPGKKKVELSFQAYQRFQDDATIFFDDAIRDLGVVSVKRYIGNSETGNGRADDILSLAFR